MYLYTPREIMNRFQLLSALVLGIVASLTAWFQAVNKFDFVLPGASASEMMKAYLAFCVLAWIANLAAFLMYRVQLRAIGFVLRDWVCKNLRVCKLLSFIFPMLMLTQILQPIALILLALLVPITVIVTYQPTWNIYFHLTPFIALAAADVLLPISPGKDRDAR
jgi:hypothetical protein